MNDAAIVFLAAAVCIGLIASGIRVLVSGKATFFSRGLGKVEYSGHQSIAPGIVLILIGSLLPLAILSAYINKFLGIDYAMPIVIGGAAAVAVGSIFFFSRKR